MAEERVINLRKERTISLTKTAKEDGELIKYAFTGLKWGKILIGGGKPEFVEETVRKYTGNFIQRLFKFGPYEEEVVKRTVYLNKSFSTAYKDVDLDSSILCYDKNKKLIGRVYFGNKTAPGIYHYGDDLVGSNTESDKDNEMIRIDFSSLPSNVEYLVVILNSYSHDKFDSLPFMQMRIYESASDNPGKSKKVFAEYRLDNSEKFANKQALCLGAFHRSGSGWKFTIDGTLTNEMSIPEIEKGSALRFVRSL